MPHGKFFVFFGKMGLFVPGVFFFLQPGESFRRTVVLAVDAVFLAARIVGTRPHCRQGAGGHVLFGSGTGLVAHFVNDAGGFAGLRAGGCLHDGAVGGQAFIGDLHTIESMQ